MVEIVAITRTLEPLERAEAKERQIELSRTHGTPSGNFPEGSNGKTRDKVAKLAGGDKSGWTIQKARAIVDAAEAEPEKFGKLQLDMDRTARVDGPYKRLKVMRHAAESTCRPRKISGAVRS